MRCIRRSQVAGLLVARGRFLLPRRISLFFFYALLLVSVTACSLESKVTNRAVAPPPAEKNKLSAIAAMPTAMDTFRALAPPEGLRFTPLFNEAVKDSDARLKRLEDAVQTIRNDLDTVVPTMVRMVAIEKDIKGLVAQLQTLTDQSQGQAAPVDEVAPQNLPPATTNGGTKIPGGDVAGGTDPSVVATAPGNPTASSSLVTPEAASKGELPPEDAASPSSNAPAALAPQVKEQPAPAAVSPQLPPPPVEKPPVSPEPKAEVKPEAKSQPLPEKKAEAEPQSTSKTGGDVKAIRIADHPDKSRVVLDMTVKGNVTAKLENNGKTLVISLPDLNWLGKKSWDADTAALISGYHIDEGNLYVDLMYPSQIKYQGTLQPDSKNKDHRFVIDLFSPEVHK